LKLKKKRLGKEQVVGGKDHGLGCSGEEEKNVLTKGVLHPRVNPCNSEETNLNPN